jgi:hypothetical protein
MKAKEVTIAGKTVALAYCYATEIAFSDYTGQDINRFIASLMPDDDGNIPTTDPKKVLYAILSAALAYAQNMEQECPIKDTDLMYEAKPADLVLALATVFELRKQWYEIPDGDTTEKAEEEDKAKN